MTKNNTSASLIDMTNSEIEEFIAKHLPVKVLEKKKYGEVFTPSALIKKILDFFPKSVWSNPDLKWLDPSCGTGNFMILVYQRLMLGLKIESDKARSKHIIQNMLYMVEINPKNVQTCKQIFGQNANIVCSDFLSDKHFFPDCNTFDCIIGNPPFQDDTNVKGTGGKSKLYERIFLKAYEMLQKGGYLSFVVPDNMLSGNGNVAYNTLIKNDVQFVSFNSEIQAFFPGIQQNICFFFMEKNDPKNKGTVIEGVDGHKFTTQLVDRPVNPVRNWTPYVEKLLNKYVTNIKNDVKYNRGKSLSLYNGTKYSIIYTSSKKLRTNKIELAPGLNIKKAVVFGISSSLDFEMDYTGKYGVGPNTFYIPFQTRTQGRNLEAFLKSDYYKTMALACKTNRQFLKIGFVEHLNLSKIFGSSVKSNNKTNKSKGRPTNNKTRRKKDNVDSI